MGVICKVCGHDSDYHSLIENFKIVCTQCKDGICQVAKEGDDDARSDLDEAQV